MTFGPKPKLDIARRLAARADEDPEGVAIAGASRRMTNAQFHRAVSEAAAFLRSRGLPPGARVGLYGHKEAALAAVYLACLHEGLTLVPLDAHFPVGWIAATAAALPVHLWIVADTPPFPIESPAVRFEELALAGSGPLAAHQVPPDTIAVILRTSGSTGDPKFVRVTHGNMAAAFAALDDILALGPGDVTLNTASISFSSSLRQILYPLLSDAGVLQVERPLIGDMGAIIDLMRIHRVSVAEMIPTLLNAFVKACAGDARLAAAAAGLPLRLLASASEPLPRALYEALRDLGLSWPVLNMYGATETTGIVAACKLTPETAGSAGPLPIGRAIGANRLERKLSLDGDEVLVVRSPQVAPTSTAGGEHGVFETGDVVTCRRDGLLVLSGRRDRQVKIGGVRVGCDEVTAALAAHPDLAEVAVVPVRGADDRTAGLRACYVAAPQVDTIGAAPEALRAFAAERLPAAAVPTGWLRLNALPRLPNLKVDYRALEMLPSRSDDEQPLDQGETGASREDDLSRALRSIWAARLGQPHVPASARFYELGGNSLMSLQIIADVGRVLGVRLPLDVFDVDDSLAGMRARIARDRATALQRLGAGVDDGGAP